MEKKIRAVVKGIDTFSEWVGKTFSWLTLTLIFLTCYEVFTRRLRGAPTIWTLEMSTFLFCGVCMLALGYTELHKGHVNVDIVYNRFPPKVQAICNIITFLCFLGIFSLILLIYGGIFAADSWAIRERTPSAFNAIVYPSKIAVPVGAFLLFIQALSGFIKDLFFLVKGERL